ncbi:MAG: protein nirF [Hyphomicrobiales bacterium]|nr:protein nirF [Hyphomicrobiales bacterium]
MTEARLSRRGLVAAGFAGLAATAAPTVARAADCASRGTGDLGLVVERATGSLLLVETTGRTTLGRIEGLGDLSHASIVFDRSERFGFVFGRDGGLTKVDLLGASIVKRVVQGGNAIGGAISDDGRLVAVSNYAPGGVRVFDAETLEMVADVPAIDARGAASKTVGLVDLPFRRFAWSLLDGDEIWIGDFTDAKAPKLEKFTGIGRLPYDGVATSDGRWYVAGLFGEDALTRLDLWTDGAKPEKVLAGYGKGEQPLPVYKMPHMEGWGAAGNHLLIPAVGHHEVLVVDRDTFALVKTIPTHGQPVFCVARPDGRQVWVNYAHPHNDTVEVIDVPSLKVVHAFKPGPAVLHLEFTPRGHEVWISVRDENRIDIHETKTFTKIASLEAKSPSGIFFTPRAHRLGV